MKLRNFSILGMLVLGLFFLNGCKEHCPPCSKIPDDAKSLVGEWEWSYSTMGSELTGFEIHERLTPENTGSVAMVEVSESGCFRFWVDNEEYCSCVKIVEADRFVNENNNYCRDRLEVEFSGMDLCYEGFLSIEGLPDCELNETIGRHFPFSIERQYIDPPELREGYVLLGYTNYFVRKR